MRFKNENKPYSILAILSFTSCVGKELPTQSNEMEKTQESQINDSSINEDDSKNQNDSSSSDVEDNSQIPQNNSAVEESNLPPTIISDSEQDVESSEHQNTQSPSIISDAQPYAKMPQSIITYLEANKDLLQYEKSMEFGEEWLVYSSCFKEVVAVGVV